MTKVLALVVILTMLIQIIKPLGAPGLRQRRDFWKLPLAGFGVISLAILLNHLVMS